MDIIRKCRKCKIPETKAKGLFSVYGFCPDCQNKFMPFLAEAIRKFLNKKRNTNKKKYFKRSCSICGSKRHDIRDSCCCNCQFFICSNQKCKKGIYTTREGICSKYKRKYGRIPPPGG